MILHACASVFICDVQFPRIAMRLKALDDTSKQQVEFNLCCVLFVQFGFVYGQCLLVVVIAPDAPCSLLEEGCDIALTRLVSLQVVLC